MAKESEKKTEAYLRVAMLKIGGWCMKWECPNIRGVPDRICQFPNGTTVYVELKSEGVTPEKHQLRMHSYMKKRGSTVWVIDTKAEVDRLIRMYDYDRD